MVPTDLQHSNTVHDMLWDDHVEGSSAGVLTYSLVGGPQSMLPLSSHAR
jgi:hypothetical protein